MDPDVSSQEIKPLTSVSEAEKSLGLPEQATANAESGPGEKLDASKASGRVSSATVFRRGIAYLIDIMIINAFVYWRTSGYQGVSEHDSLLIIVPAIYFLLYFPLLEGSLFHATLGKALVGIKVVDQSGRGIKIVRAFCRHLCKLLFGIPTAFLSWFFAGVHPRGQSLHDVVTRSYVVVRSKG
jgi:uncharacterized RDD family membrane protein YckC